MTLRTSHATMSRSVPQHSSQSETIQDETASEPKLTQAQAAVWQGDPATDADDRQRAIREAAYRRFEERGCVHGRDLEDWLEAEAQVESSRD